MILSRNLISNLAIVLLACVGMDGTCALGQTDDSSTTADPSPAEVATVLLAPSPDAASAESSTKSGKGTKAKKAGKGKRTEEKPALSIPIPVGDTVKGIKVPYFSMQGDKQMEFYATLANRIDDERIELDAVRLETFTEDGESDMVITFPKSVFYVTEQNIVSDTEVVIRRKDFRIRGEAMNFDTRNRKGKIIGKVNMLIFNKEGMITPKSSQSN